MKSILTLLAISLLTTPLLAQDWEIIQQDPSVMLYDIQMLPDGITGWACGGNKMGSAYLSAIYKTTNGGLNWEELPFSFSNSVELFDLFFLNANLGWAVGQDGVVLKTTDGGDTWDFVFSGTTRQLNSVFFVDENNGWACGGWSDGNQYLVLRTFDGGDTWEDYSFGSTAFTCTTLFFLDESHGYMGGQNSDLSPFVRYTADGGLTWEVQDLPLPITNINVTSIDFPTEDQGWLAISSLYTPGAVLHTEDGGENWSIQTLTNLSYNVIDAQDENNLAVASVRILSPADRKVFVSSDGGSTWDSYQQPILQYTNGISYVNNRIWLASDLSGISYSADGGQSWEVQNYSPLFSSITWASEEKGFATAGYTFGIQDYAIKTEDGGATWNYDPSIPGGVQMFFVDEQRGWSLIEGSNAKIWRTTDGGELWNLHNINNGNDFIQGVYFLNENIGWVYGSNGALRISIDGGVNWSPVPTPTSNFIQDVVFLNNDQGWAAGGFGAGNGFILYTPNGGANWVFQSIADDAQVMDLFFLDDQRGWACMIGGGTQRTQDGGETWQLMGSVDHEFTEGIWFLDDNTGFLLARNGVGALSDGRGFLYRSDDGGASWELDYTNTWPSSSLGSFAMQGDSISLWVSGDHNTLLELPLTIITTDIAAPAQPELYTNVYPNPSSDWQQIVYELPKASEVSVRILDQQGRVVRILEESSLAAGKHGVVWDGKTANGQSTPAGSYWIQILWEEGIVTRPITRI